MRKRMVIGSYVTLMVVLAVATGLEHRYGTEFVGRQVYGTGWFFALWTVLAVGIGGAIVRARLWRNWAVGGLHLAFLCMLAGAAATALTGRQGHVRLFPGVPVRHYTDAATDGRQELPFVLCLDSFRIRLHRQTLHPSDYVSYLRIDGQPARVSMNRVLERRHYRFSQASYEEDGSSWLSVSRDPWGIGLTYVGYGLWGVSVVGLLFFRKRLPDGDVERESGSTVRVRSKRPWGDAVQTLASVSVLLLLFLQFGLRWKKGGHIPLSNGFETLLFLALCVLSVSIAYSRRFPILQPVGLWLSAAALVMAFLGPMDASVSPLAPVLASPLLGFHVATVMAGYALLALVFAVGVAGLLRPARREELARLSRRLLYPAVCFLGTGIFLGAVWANQSWGRYWAWDPKEVWALVTFMVYGVAFHRRSLAWLRRPLGWHLYLTGAFLTVLMTYFGVNFLLGGMHSYMGG